MLYYKNATLLKNALSFFVQSVLQMPDTVNLCKSVQIFINPETNMMPNDGLIIENMDLSHMRLVVFMGIPT